MKRKLILGSLIALSGIVTAQNFNTTGTSNSIYRSGNTGFGMSSAPSTGNIIEVETTSPETGIMVTQKTVSGAGAAALHLNNVSTGGNLWSLFSLGSGNTIPGTGNFVISNSSNGGASYTNRMLINKTTGNVGIGTINPSDSKVHVVNQITSYPSSNIGNGGFFDLSSNQVGVYCSVFGNCSSSYAGGGGDYVGVNGKSLGNGSTSHGTSYGVSGTASGNYYNYGGYFEVTSSSNSVINYGVFGNANSISGAYAGYFQGNVYATGLYNGSDFKLKENIKSVTGALDKIKLLKPSTYTFKRKEFPGMSLPEGQQLGLIAQDLEKIYPELISEIAERPTKNGKGETVMNPNFKSVNYIGLIPVLIAGIQEQQKQLEEQKQQIADLTNQVNAKSANPTGINEIKGADGFAMEQNIPNPFTSETTIKYTLTQQTKSASLVVYDLSGKQITTFQLDSSAPSITITSEKLSPGIYIYSVTADGKIMDSKRMVVASK